MNCKYMQIFSLLNELDEIVRLVNLLTGKEKEQGFVRFSIEEAKILRNNLKVMQKILAKITEND